MTSADAAVAAVAGGRWDWLGGRPAMDFVNTCRERWRGGVETLCAPEDLIDWLVQAQLLPWRMPAPPGLLEEAWALREAIEQGVRAVAGGEPADRAALRLIDEIGRAYG